MRSEYSGGRWVLLGGVFLLVTGCTTYTEVALFLFGHDGTATVERTYETRSRRTTKLTVEYQFTDDDGTRRHDDATVSRHTAVPGPGGTIGIRYSNGPFRASRLLGHVGWVGIGFATVGFGLIAYGAIDLVRNRSEPRRRRRSRRSEEEAES
jgi:hypothetical protein